MNESEKVSETILSLPMHAYLEDEQIKFISEKIKIDFDRLQNKEIPIKEVVL